MKYYDLLGYAYDADLHCLTCTRARFGSRVDDPGTEDADGNPPHPIFAGDETDPSGEYCGDCGYEIVEPIDGPLFGEIQEEE